MDLLDHFYSILLISFGAILGSNIRLFIYNILDKLFLIRRHYKVLFVNNFASFFLGLSLAASTRLINPNDLNTIYFFFSIGFLGSLSTFSTFIYDLFEISAKYKFINSIKFIVISISFGLIALWLGYLIGNL